MKCPQKIHYPSFDAAEQARIKHEEIIASDKGELRAYRCRCGSFHVGHKEEPSRRANNAVEQQSAEFNEGRFRFRLMDQLPKETQHRLMRMSVRSMSVRW